MEAWLSIQESVDGLEVTGVHATKPAEGLSLRLTPETCAALSSVPGYHLAVSRAKVAACVRDFCESAEEYLKSEDDTLDEESTSELLRRMGWGMDLEHWEVLPFFGWETWGDYAEEEAQRAVGDALLPYLARKLREHMEASNV